MEAKLRKEANKKGLKLSKGICYYTGFYTYKGHVVGTNPVKGYMLIDRDTNAIVAGYGCTPYMLDIKDVVEFLNEN